jgi:hypothetical protein
LIENEIKKLVIGRLLEVLKITFETLNYLPKGGADLKTLSNLQEEIWKSISQVSCMPKEERNGFVADEYLAAAFGYVAGNLSRDEAVNKILNWKSDSVDVVGDDDEKKNSQCSNTSCR